jgi:hypothetical protein
MLPFQPPAPPMPSMGGMPAGDPMAAGMQPMMPGLPLGGGMHPMDLIERLIHKNPEWKNDPPPGWRKPKKPTSQQIWTDAMREEGRNTERTNRMMDTVARLRFERVGIFPADVDARSLGDQDEWKASDLIDDNNMLCAILASMEESFHKRPVDRSHHRGTQVMEDAARYFRDEEIYRWANRVDMPLKMAESKVLSIYGVIWASVFCNLDDPDFPFDVSLRDPASLYFHPGGNYGPERVYSVMRMTQSQAFAIYGEPRKKDADRIKRLTNGADDESAIVRVCEYADTLYHAAVIQDGIELLPITEHRYYTVPFVGQGGPAGEPLFTDTGRAATEPRNRIGSDWWQSGPNDDWGMKHKLTSSITAQQERHDQLEAIMARIVTNLQDAIDPALIVKRDNLMLGKPLPKIDRRRGRRSEIGIGEDVIPVPTSVNPGDWAALREAIQQDMLRGQIPLGMYGQAPASQATGNSISVAAEAGMDHVTPWVSALESFQTRKIEKMFDYWRRKGHLSRFYDAQERPFMVPISRPIKGQDLAVELTPELLDAMGPRVRVTKTRLRVQDMIALANAAGPLSQIGYPARRIFERMGEEDYDRLREEWMEEQKWNAIMNDPEMMASVTIPMQIYQWAQEATDPEQKAMLMALLDTHMAKQMQQQQPAPMPPGMPSGGMPTPTGGGPFGPPTGAPPLTAPVAGNTMHQAGLGAGPGTMGAPVGRPPVF